MPFSLGTSNEGTQINYERQLFLIYFTQLLHSKNIKDEQRCTVECMYRPVH